jgi:hypothetical protein
MEHKLAKAGEEGEHIDRPPRKKVSTSIQDISQTWCMLMGSINLYHRSRSC